LLRSARRRRAAARAQRPDADRWRRAELRDGRPRRRLRRGPAARRALRALPRARLRRRRHRPEPAPGHRRARAGVPGPTRTGAVPRRPGHGDGVRALPQHAPQANGPLAEGRRCSGTRWCMQGRGLVLLRRSAAPSHLSHPRRRPRVSLPPDGLQSRAMVHARALAFLCLAVSCSVRRGQELPGPREDGSILLPSGWSLTPHGEQLPLPFDLPVRLALHPLGRFLAVQHAGYREHAISLVDLDADAVTAVLPIPKSWSGLAWSADGRRLYVSGGVEDRLHVFSFEAATGRCAPESTLPVGDGARLDLVAGLCVDDEERLYVCLQRSDRLVRIDAQGRQDWEVTF